MKKFTEDWDYNMMKQKDSCQFKEELHEECGVFGAYNTKGEVTASWVYYGCSLAAPGAGKLRYCCQRKQRYQVL